MQRIHVLDKEFEISIHSQVIQETIASLADRMNRDLQGKNIIFLGILNGAFMFATDLIKRITLDCQISFLKLASYQGTTSSGKIKRLIGLTEDVRACTILVIEDIVDSGKTIEHIMKQLRGYEPEDIKIATLLFKPDAYKGDLTLDYVGFEIPDNFVVGYGLDYDGFGRNHEHIYTLVE